MADTFPGFLAMRATRSLRLVEVFRLQATSTCIRDVCMEQVHLSDLLADEFPGLHFSPALLKPACRRSLVSLLHELHQPQVSIDGEAHVELRNAAEMQKLTKLLGTAIRLAQTMLPIGGSLGHVLVDHMQFPREELPMALQRSHLAPEESPMCVGDSCCLQCTGLLGDFAAKTGEAPAAPNTWTIHFSFQGGLLCLAVNSDYDMGGFQRLSVDIAVCSSSFTLCYRNVDVVVNGAWSSCHMGFFAMTGGRDATVEALSTGVPCVILIRQGHSDSELGFVHSLNLDTVRRPN